MTTFDLDIKGIQLDEIEFKKLMTLISYKYKEDVKSFITRAIRWQMSSDYNSIDMYNDNKDETILGDFDEVGNLIPYCEKCHEKLKSEIKIH